MYLNDFRIAFVLSLLDKIKQSNIDGLVFDIDIKRKSKCATLSYCSFLHKVTVKSFNPYKDRLYPNPTASVSMVTASNFIAGIVPSEKYYQLIN